MQPKPRYRHKLNMMVPGGWMCLIIVALGLVCALFSLLSWHGAAVWCGALAGGVLLVLIVLLCIEQHQDRVLYEDAKRDDPDIP